MACPRQALDADQHPGVQRDPHAPRLRGPHLPRALTGLQRRNRRIARCVSCGFSSWGTWPQSQLEMLRARQRVADVVGEPQRHELVELAPDEERRWLERRAGGSRSPSRRAAPRGRCCARRRRRPRGRPGSGTRGGTRRRPPRSSRRTAPGTSRRTISSTIGRGAGWIAPSSGGTNAQELRPTAGRAARPATGASSARRRTRSGWRSPSSSATRPPIELPMTSARSMPERVEQLDDAAGEERRVVRGAERLGRVAEARQVDGDRPVVRGQRGDGRQERGLRRAEAVEHDDRRPLAGLHRRDRPRRGVDVDEAQPRLAVWRRPRWPRGSRRRGCRSWRTLSRPRGTRPSRRAGRGELLPRLRVGRDRRVRAAAVRRPRAPRRRSRRTTSWGSIPSPSRRIRASGRAGAKTSGS